MQLIWACLVQVAVLPLELRVAWRKLAAALGVRARRLAMAPADRLCQLCGYPMGSVPPLGHEPRLPVVLDRSITQHRLCLIEPDGELVGLQVMDLLRVTGASVADITAADASSESDSGAESDADAGLRPPELLTIGAPEARRGVDELPLPWEAGAKVVTLEGLIAQKRKIAKLLLFASLVPAPRAGSAVPPLLPAQQATYLRRLWRCPEGEQGRACEVQLILGKTLADQFGRDAAAELIRGVRVGQVVRVVGAPQLQPSIHATRREGVRDVVVHSIHTLREPEDAAAEAATAAAEAAARARAEARAAAGARAAPALELPPAVRQHVVAVEGMAGLQQLEECLFGVDGASNEACSGGDGAGTAESASSAAGGAAFGSLAAYRAAVGVDAEWVPYRRGEPHTLVALLQLAVLPLGAEPWHNLQEEKAGSALQAQVFLIDLLAICSSSSLSNAGTPAPAPAPQQLGAPEPTPLEQRLSSILQQAFEDPRLAKTGFKLSHDLLRLCESYPHLPCFGSQGAVAFRSHVDIQRLACAVLPPASPLSSRAGQRLQRADVGLSALTAGVTDVAAFRPGSGVASGLTGRRLANHRLQAACVRSAAMAPLPQQRDAGTSTGTGGTGTLSMQCNVEHLLAQYLGQELPAGGKGPAVRAGAADARGAEPARTPRFPRGSGVLEWGNAFMLFVNLQASEVAGSFAALRYDNRWLWLETEEQQQLELAITWWPGRGRTAAHNPVMQRMLAGGGEELSSCALGEQGNGAAADTAAGTNQQRPQQPAPAVLLFCRPASGGTYVFCGRLQQAQAHSSVSGGSSGGDCIVWRLVDWPALKHSTAFRQLLALQQQGAACS
eukprot:scaffold1.g5384.t1